MAVIEFINRRKKTPQTYGAMKRVLDYIMLEDKTSPHLITAAYCSPQTAYDEFVQVKQEYGKEKGRLYIHFTQAFHPDEKVMPEIAAEIAKRIITLPLFDGFQIAAATHTDREHLHTHFVVNSVNAKTGAKWQLSAAQLQELKDFSDELCREYGLSVIEDKEKGHKSSGEYRSEQEGRSWKYELFLAVTSCMRVAINRGDFINKMNELEYKVSWEDNRKYILFETPDGHKSRNRKLYPPERFTKENLEKIFEQNRQFQAQWERDEFWNNLLTVLFFFTGKNKSGSRQGKYPLSALEGEALKEELIKRENQGEIDWGDGEGNGYEDEL